MKKTFLVILVLVMTAASSLASNISEGVNEDLLQSDFKDEKLSIGEDDGLIVDSQKVVASGAEVLGETFLDKIAQINSIEYDEQKIKAWAKLSSSENYLIVNKKECSATVYDKDGIVINRFEVGIGKDIGDDFNDTSGLLGKSKNTTPAGEYILNKNISNKAEYGEFSLSLGKTPNKPQNAKNVVALHSVPNFRKKERIDKFYDGNLQNNRMSHGCINFIEKDFESLKEIIHSGFRAYVLPEETDNHLVLAKNSKDEFELIQTKYKK